MEKSDFDQLLERYLAGQVTEEEKTKLEAWLEVMKTEDTTHLELTAEDETKLFQKITSHIQGNTESIGPITDFRPRQIIKEKTNRWLLRMAASIAILVGVASAWYFVYRPQHPAIGITQALQVDKMILNDGTLVWLRGEGKLAYTEKQDSGIRYAELSGEALFEVAKDPGKPFLIQCSNMTIKVVGTSFSLKADNDSVVLKVLTGRVQMFSAKDHINLSVGPRQKVVFGKGQAKEMVLPQNEIAALTENTEYNMQFENAILKEVLQKLGKKFDVSIVALQQANQCRITADLTDHSLNTSLQMISEVLDITITREGKSIIINGKGCK
jgi:transmembrane sensor